ncbi:hypothetical protein MAR_033841 [Mya arenaria]|uniref:Uncharacterized protein n=1 Tax=Mya arenaria TaxID=6604 RepID=A0ABY7GD87_MYAAR|nr:hypothetical protein MAR_033841 [Mya arenaria]
MRAPSCHACLCLVTQTETRHVSSCFQ